MVDIALTRFTKRPRLLEHASYFINLISFLEFSLRNLGSTNFALCIKVEIFRVMYGTIDTINKVFVANTTFPQQNMYRGQLGPCIGPYQYHQFL